ncbi:hypothetical protein SAMN04489858_105246 [Paracoccus homiensis]|uniref:Uncharacterized protein n=1 Tax=Paracoccus homiensis TaxID=364199 RepID=A0A1I0EP06_9RHOB|nr:hypothetical protein SAMN04489858_105246 [Paracoccus homiensis]
MPVQQLPVWGSVVQVQRVTHPAFLDCPVNLVPISLATGI